MTSRRPLLGHLAEHGWFTQMGEPAATQALAVLLQEPELLRATHELVHRAIGADVNMVERFVAEAVAPDRARPDLEGLDADARPRLVIEMKFGAGLDEAQLLAYLRNQANRLADEDDRALVALLPDSRRAEAQRCLEAAVSTWSAEAAEAATHLTVGVVTWGEWLEAWESAAPDDGPRSVAADVAQLRAMCETLDNLVIPPFDAALDSGDWGQRIEDLGRLADAVSLRATGERILPVGDESSGYLRRRYFRTGGPDPETHLSLGVHPRFAEEGSTPLWARLHRQVPGFAEAKNLILTSRLASGTRTDDGHLWIPIQIPPGLSGGSLVDKLWEQVVAIQVVLRGEGEA